ncbi:response regulator transcription factor [uncultured Roseobacter sp.]|uniref:response regulator transcription factor n=1 Tax=uncultured Roseobacter sp. TaxID=114847 RepID=UPI002638A295|nr:response regulator transcription factor [uncultured Roseobacter sp.]
MHVLMLDDDAELGEAMEPAFNTYGIELSAAHTPSAAFKLLESRSFDVLLLDMMLPELDGMSVCRKIRGSQSAYAEIPIVALTARSGLTDRVVALESGVDDVIAKPVEMRELVARLGAVSRRIRASDSPAPPAAPQLAVSRATMSASYAEHSVNLTELEMRIIEALHAHPDTFLTREEILRSVGYDMRSDPAMIDTIIYRIRQKFRDQGLGQDFIRTGRGKGYAIMLDQRS